MANRMFALRTHGGIAALVTAFAACGGGGAGNVGVCSSSSYTACGGDPTGKWNITGICTENSISSLMSQSIGDSLGSMPSSCSGLVKSANMAVSGTVTYSSGTVTYDMNTTVTGSLSFTSACLSDMAGTSMVVTATLCSSLESSMNSSGSGSPDVHVTCSVSGSSCSCNYTETASNPSSDTYTVSGTTITEGGMDTYDFCVSGKTMTERDTSSTAGFAVLSLSKS